MLTIGSMVQEVRLLFTPADNGSFAVRLEDIPGHTVGVAVTLLPFLGEDDFENLRWYLEDYMDLPDGGAVIRAQGVEKQIEEWGHRLHDAVFAAPENARVLRTLLAAPEPRALTIATDQSVLLRLPWECRAENRPPAHPPALCWRTSRTATRPPARGTILVKYVSFTQ